MNNPGCNLEFLREDDYLEYFVYPQVPDSLLLSTEDNSEDKLRIHLNAWLKHCKNIADKITIQRRHIWHKDEFNLELRTCSAKDRLLNEEWQGKNDRGMLPPHLHGVTHFGDNIADEWFIVHLLCELTREIPDCIVRVVDADGEFLLIEAADALPKWANPESCEQRVYIADGYVHLVQNSPSNTIKLMEVNTAIKKIRQNPTLYRVSKEIQECINERLKEFKEPINNSLHCQIVRLPLGVASLLKQRPKLIAPAIRAFCERDTIDMKACRTMRFFPPEERVRTSVLFTRCLYAMLMHNKYVPDRKIGWDLSCDINTQQYKEDLLGVKIASGFEILASHAKHAAGDEQDPAWRAYLQNLCSKGYFRDQLEGSEEHNRLLAEARSYFKRNNDRFRTVPLVGREILHLHLLRNVDLSIEHFRGEENNLQPSDDDDWLNITSEQLDAMLTERYGPKKLYKSNGDINAEEFTKNFSEFLEKQSEFEGIDPDSYDDDEPGASSISAKKSTVADSASKLKKNRSMRKACEKNPVLDAGGPNDNGGTTHVRNFLDFVIPEDNWDSTSEMSDYGDEDDLERNMKAMNDSERNIDMDVDIKSYMDQMDRELQNTTIGQSFERDNMKSGGTQKTGATVGSTEDDFDDIESFKPVNINVNTLKNMMDSYKSQLGGTGPVSNLMHAMGVGMSTATTATSNDDEKSDNLMESSL